MNISLDFKFSLILSVLIGSSCQKLSSIVNDFSEIGLSIGDEVNVLMFADSTSNDHDMIQMAIDYAADNGIYRVFVPAGEYFIDASGIGGSMGISLRNNINLRLEGNTILRAIPNDTSTYYVLRVHDVENVKISGGKIFGEREDHVGTAGEWGMSIDLKDTSNIRIDSVYIANCWGDGIYIGKGSNFNVQINGVVCDNNRSLTIMNYETEGIYIYEVSAEITIVNSLLTTDNSGALGIQIGTSEAIEIGNIEVKGGAIGISSGYDEGVTITASRMVVITEYPIRLYRTDNSSIEGLYIDSCVSKHTMLLQYSNDNQVSDNTFRFNEFLSDNTYSYIVIDNTSHNNVIDNNTIIVDSPTFKSQYGIWLKSATYDNSITGITIDSTAYVVSPIFDQGTGNVLN